MTGKQPAFWLAVGGTAILAMITLNIASDKLPFQALKTLDAYVTRRNG